MTNSQTIMIVDDEPQIGQMLTQFLGKHNYEALFFTSGKEALIYLQNNFAISLLLTDMAMPEMTGIELVQQVKKLYPALPIIVMSGTADGQHRDEIFKLGADFITKPLDFVDLLRRMDLQITQSGRPADAKALAGLTARPSDGIPMRDNSLRSNGQ